MIAALLVLVAARALLVGAGEALAGRSAQHLVGRLREDLAAHVSALGPAYVAGVRSAVIASTMVDGLEALDAWARSFMPARVLAVVVPALVLAVVLVVDPLSALVLLVTGPVLVALLGLIGARVGPATAAREAELRWMRGYFADMLRGLATLRAYGRSAEQADRIHEIGLRYGASTMAVLRTAFQASLVLEWGAAVAMALVAVELSLRLMTGGIGFEATLAVLVIAPEFFGPLRRLATHYHEGAAGREAAARALDILDTPEPRRGRRRAAASAVEARTPAQAPSAVEARAPRRHRPRGGLGRLPRPRRPGARRRLRSSCPPGAGPRSSARRAPASRRSRGSCSGSSSPTRAGSSWAGRTSRRARGRVARADRVRAAGAPPVRRHGRRQHPARPSRRDGRGRRGRRARRRRRRFIADLPDGYATALGEDGVRLSGGQRQRIAISRAFLRDAELVILDEPTAHLDPDAEAAIAAAVDRLAAGRTVVVISHRSALVTGADLVVELDRGRVVR